jgi:hypothetical protein
MPGRDKSIPLISPALSLTFEADRRGEKSDRDQAHDGSWKQDASERLREAHTPHPEEEQASTVQAWGGFPPGVEPMVGAEAGLARGTLPTGLPRPLRATGRPCGPLLAGA